MTFIPWQFTSPYISYTPILAPAMNSKLTGISVSFTYIADQLNNFVPALPSNFTGNVKAVDGPYHNTLLGVSPEGDVELVDRGQFALAVGKDLSVTKYSGATLSVSGDDHATLYYMEHTDADPDAVITVTVGEAIAMVDGSPAVAPATIILFTQATANSLVFAELPGVTVKSPGLLKARKENSTVGLMAIDQFTWVLVGEIYLDDEIV